MLDDPLRLGWVVGIIEGEGYIGWTDKAHVNVTMCDLDTVERLKEWSGLGVIRTIKRQKDHHKQLWLWQVARQDEFVRLASMIRPHLSVRRGLQLAHALEMLAQHRNDMAERAAKRQKFCRSGHTREEVGTYSDDRCAQCQRDRMSRNYYSKRENA